MIWNAPWAFWLFLLLLPLAGLFFYRKQAVPLTIPSLMLWESHLQASLGGPLGRRFRRLATFLVQAAILAALVLAMADPKRPGGGLGDVTIIIDCSATMQTLEPSGRTRLQEAGDVAQAIVNDAPAAATVTIIRAGFTPDVAVRTDSDRSLVREAITSLTADDTDTDLGEAIRHAVSLSPPNRPARIVCVSDFCDVDTVVLRRACSDARLVQVGSSQPTLGIVALRMSPNRREAAVTIAGQPVGSRDVTLVLWSGDRELQRQTVRIDKQTREVLLPMAMKPGEPFRLTLKPDDALSLDNTAWGVVPRDDRVRIRLVSWGNPFLEGAVRAQPTAILEVVTPDAWSNDGKAEVTILDGPVVASLSTIPGLMVVFSPTEANPAELYRRNATEVEVAYWIGSHPVLKNADPSMWGAVRGSIPMTLPSSRVLVAAADRPIVLECAAAALTAPGIAPAVPAMHAIIFNIDLARSDLPLKPALPVLLWDTIDYLRGEDSSSLPVARSAGMPLTVATSRGGEAPRVMLPNGGVSAMLPSGSGYIYHDTRRQGLYEYGEGNNRRRVAMNWFSMRSAAPFERLAAEPPAETGVRAAVVSRLSWRLLLACMLAAGAIEWLFFHCRWLRID